MVAVFSGEHDRCLAFTIAYGRLGLRLNIGKDGLEDLNLLGTNCKVDGRSVLDNIGPSEKGLGSRLEQRMHTFRMLSQHGQVHRTQGMIIELIVASTCIKYGFQVL